MTLAAPSRRAIIHLALACLIALPFANARAATTAAMPTNARVLFLHHSTGWIVWANGVSNWFSSYNASHGTSYSLTELYYPFDPYPKDSNYPFDYWNLWVNHAGTTPYLNNPTLEMLTAQYDVIVLKHCFPVGAILPDLGTPNVASSEKRLENYLEQYDELKAKLRQFPNTRFIVWTGAAKLASETTPAMANRAHWFANWVENTWDEPGDNIFVWDFFNFETDGGVYMNPAYSNYDSHPNDAFAATVAPQFCQRTVDVIRGYGDTNGVADATSPAPEGLTLSLASPSPGRGPVRFRIELPGASPVALEVYDTAGRRVARVDGGSLGAGTHEIAWTRNAQRVGRGIYFAKVVTDLGVRTHRIVLLD